MGLPQAELLAFPPAFSASVWGLHLTTPCRDFSSCGASWLAETMTLLAALKFRAKCCSCMRSRLSAFVLSVGVVGPGFFVPSSVPSRHASQRLESPCLCVRPWTQECCWSTYGGTQGSQDDGSEGKENYSSSWRTLL